MNGGCPLPSLELFVGMKPLMHYSHLKISFPYDILKEHKNGRCHQKSFIVI